MPKTFLKPFDYSVDLLLRAHPTLKDYVPLLPHAEVDPDYHLYPEARKRYEPKDEIMLKNNMG